VASIAVVTIIPGAAILAVIRFTWQQDDPTTWNLTYRLAAIGLLVAAVAIACLVREAPASHLAAERAARASWRDELRRVLELPNARVLIVAGALLAAAGASTGRLFPVWANKVMGAGAPDLVDLSIVTSALAFVAAVPGLWLAGRAHPRTLAVAAAVVGGLATTAHVFVTELWMFAVAATIAVPLTVAAVAAGIPLLLRLVPPGESLGESVGMVAGPLALVTSIAAYASALLVDAFGDYRLIWLVAGAFTLAAAVALSRLDVPEGEERTDLRALFAQLRRSDSGRGGLFGGTVEDADVLADAGVDPLDGEVQELTPRSV
jgi:MFS-type transporter involved in bile tolerance (Atg22 family)